MKKLLSTLFAIAFAAAAGAAFAEEDEAMAVAPNAQRVIVTQPGAAPQERDEAMDVAPNARTDIPQVPYVWGSYPTD